MGQKRDDVPAPGGILMAEPEPFVDATKAAEFLGVSRDTVNYLAREGRIPAHPLPTGATGKRRYWRFRLSELAEFMAKQKAH